MATLTERLFSSLSSIPDSPVSKLVIGPHWTVCVTADGRCGMSSSEPSNPHCATHEQRAREFDTGAIVGNSTMHYAELAAKPDGSTGIMSSICQACLNALLPPLDPQFVSDGNAREELMERGAGKTVAMFGSFPYAKRVATVAKRMIVLELHPKEGEYHADCAPELVPEADIVCMTGSTVVNHTIDGILALCKPDTWIMMMGQSSPMHPVVFDAGIDAVAGVQITDPDALIESVLVRGGCQGSLKGIKKIMYMKQ